MTHLGPEAADPLSDAERARLNGHAPNGDEGDAGECLMPIPDDAELPPARLMRSGNHKADQQYEYRDAQGRPLGYILRFEARDGRRKFFLPLTYWRDANGRGEWRREAWPKGRRPLFGLEKLAARPNAKVLLVEGEKTANALEFGPLADAFKWRMQNVIAVTWPGGGSAEKCADFSPLKGRDVIIAPDAQMPGETTADELVKILQTVGVRSLRRWKAPPEAQQVKNGWDIADALPPGWTAEALVQSILDAPEVGSKAVLRVEDWLTRDLPKPDFILGSWLTTTSRVLLTAPTGLGKTLFGIATSAAISPGEPFLSWQGRRPCNVLYIDGEMSQRLLQSRLVDEARRSGGVPAGLHVLSHADIENFQPLNTEAGRSQIEEIIARIGKLDLIWFDNVMSLIAGDMKDEEGWRQTLPWQHCLTKRNIGQIWIHHTGHNESRAYGTKTREWQMDTCIFLENAPRHDTDVSFKLTFDKARERTPATRADFADITVALVDDTWTYSDTRSAPPGKKLSPLAAKFLEALLKCETVMHKGRRCVPMEAWRAECVKLRLIDPNAKPDSARALFSRYRHELVTCNLVACDEDFARKI
jgi:hypothetical protein